MITTKRKPDSVGQILVEEFLSPLGLTQGALAEATGLPRKHVNELCRGRRGITADTALILARAFGNSAEFWLNLQRRNGLWGAMNVPERRARIDRARPVTRVASSRRSPRCPAGRRTGGAEAPGVKSFR